MADHHADGDGRSRGQRWVENIALTLVSRFAMLLCTALVSVALWVFSDKMADIKTSMVELNKAIGAVNASLQTVKTNDAVQDTRIDSIVRADAERDRRLNRIETKVFP